jgi:hypothetical protein
LSRTTVLYYIICYQLSNDDLAVNCLSRTTVLYYIICY